MLAVRFHLAAQVLDLGVDRTAALVAVVDHRVPVLGLRDGQLSQLVLEAMQLTLGRPFTRDRHIPLLRAAELVDCEAAQPDGEQGNANAGPF